MTIMDRKIEFLPLDEEGLVCTEKDRFLPSEPEHERRRMSVVAFFKDHRSSGGVVWLCHAILLSISATLFLLSLSTRCGVSYDLYHARHFSPYSPAAPVVESHTERYSVSGFVDDSEYVGYGPEVDLAWNHITHDVGDQMISREELERLGLDPLSMKIENRKTGEDGYRVGLQVFHQLQCLNLLRQDSFRDYYSQQSRDFKGPRQVLRRHLDHCIETIRMSLMCQSDVGVFTYKHYEGIEGRWPDLNTLHTCRNFDAIRDWASANKVASK